jgi:hypothetical protein
MRIERWLVLSTLQEERQCSEARVQRRQWRCGHSTWEGCTPLWAWWLRGMDAPSYLGLQLQLQLLTGRTLVPLWWRIAVWLHAVARESEGSIVHLQRQDLLR